MYVERQIFAGLAGAIVKQGGLDTLPALRQVPQRWIVIQSTEVAQRQGRRRSPKRPNPRAAVCQRRARTRRPRSGPARSSAGASSTRTPTASWCCACRAASASRCSPRTATRSLDARTRAQADDRARFAARGARARRAPRQLRAEGDPVLAVPRRRQGVQRRTDAQPNGAHAALDRRPAPHARSRADALSQPRRSASQARSTASARSYSAR